MQRLPAGLAALCLLPGVAAHAQLAAGRPVQQAALTGAAERQVAEIRLELSAAGDWQTLTNSYTELADGLNYWDEDRSEWAESRAELELADGGAVGRHAHQRAWFSPNVNDPEGAARLWTADGRRFRTSVLALSYRDAATGREALLATLKDTAGELLPPNQVFYRDAFEGLHADVVYTFRTTGVEQDVILRESPPDPEDFGLLAETTRLQALTEVMEAPAPVKERRLIATVEDAALRALMAEPDWVDERLSFGSFRLAQGRAFSLGERAADEAEDIPVAKTWSAEPDGRVLLVEAAEYPALSPALARLPVPPGILRRQRAAWTPELRQERMMAALAGREAGAFAAARTAPVRRLAAATAPRQLSRSVMVAQAGRPERPGVVLDWRSESGSLTNYVFRGDETYLLSGAVTCTGTNTVFEAGAVLKYASNATLTVQTPLDWQGSLYRPVVLTARDDWTVGQGITTSNALSGLYATKALVLDAGTDRTFTLGHLRVAHARRALEIIGRTGHVLSHVQLVNCADGVRADGADYSLRNALFHNVATNLLQGAAATARLEQVTVNTATRFNHNVGAVHVTNSVLAGVTTPGTYTANAVSVHASAAGVFQAVGAGFNYLAAGSTNRNAGTTAINPALRLELRGLTTYPPVVQTASFTADTTLFPQAMRDTDVPDRGYHYPPLDYYWSALNLTNATLRLTNGAVVGLYGTTGLTLRRGAKLFSDGAPAALNRFVRYHTVQEQGNWGGGPASTAFTMFSVSASSPYPELRCSFTDFSTLAVTTNTTTSRVFLNAGLAVLALSHCQIRGPALSYYGADSYGPVFAFTNNLWECAGLDLSQFAPNFPYTASIYNNLFRRGYVTLDSSLTNGVWTIKDNLLDANKVTVNGTYFTATHNGFRSGLTAFGSNNKTGLTLDYAAGPLGSYYYALTGGTTNLVNAGSRNATNAGLYHFTVRTDKVKETNSVVDIGFHHVAGPQAGVRFIGTDSTTQGSWKGIHGTDGHNVINDSTNYPAYVTVIPSGHTGYTWSSSTADVRALEKAAGGRIAACWYSGTYFDVTLTPTDRLPHRLAFYCLDWDSNSRGDTFAPRDTGTGTVLDTQAVSAFNGGRYVIWDFVGNVTFRVSLGGLANAVVSGLFFGPGQFFAADGDGDGLPDHHEDRNGDGSAAGDATSWLAYDSPNGLSGPLSLSLFTPLK